MSMSVLVSRKNQVQKLKISTIPIWKNHPLTIQTNRTQLAIIITVIIIIVIPSSVFQFFNIFQFFNKSSLANGTYYLKFLNGIHCIATYVTKMTFCHCFHHFFLFSFPTTTTTTTIFDSVTIKKLKSNQHSNSMNNRHHPQHKPS